MKNKVLHTEWGTAKLQKTGYYRITSKKEGYANKHLHRLIFEKFYGMDIPKGFVIHHKNENKEDNCILNLQLMSKKQHQLHHNGGNKHWTYNNPMSIETRRKISEAGKGRIVSDETKKKISQFHKGRKRSVETCKRISESKKGKKLSEDHKLKLSEAHKGHIHSKEQKEKIGKSISKSQTSTGIYRVSKHKNKNVKQGFVWRYIYRVNGKVKEIVSIDIEKLKQKVLDKGLDWIIFDESKINEVDNDV